MPGAIVKVIVGELGTKTKGAAFKKAYADALSPSAIASKKPAQSKKK